MIGWLEFFFCHCEFSQINEEDFFNSLGEFEEFEVNSGESDSDSDEVPESRALNILNFIFKWNDSIKWLDKYRWN